MTEANETSRHPDAPIGLELSRLSDDELTVESTHLAEAERELRIEMEPLRDRERELAGKMALLATEFRRRDRQRQLAKRREVRSQVQAGEAPSIQQLVESADPTDLEPGEFDELDFLLETGGVIALGYPGSRVPTLQMTDGGAVATVSSLAEARRRYQLGWDFGVPARRGVRVHTPGTRLERLLEPDKCFVRARQRTGAGPSQVSDPGATTADG